jgi:hypothetical protein
MAPAPAYVVRCCSGLRLARISLIPALCTALAALGCGESRSSSEQRIQVYLSAPVAGADVFLWWVDGDGHPLRKDGRRHASAGPDGGLDPSTAVAAGVTDASGSVVIDDADFLFGTFVLMARGGSYVDPWLLAEGSSTEEATISLADTGTVLWSVVTDHVPPAKDSAYGMELPAFVISPMTTLARAMAERRLDPRLAGRSLRDDLWFETTRDTFALLGAHLGEVDLTRGPLPDWLPGMPEQSGDPVQPDENDAGPPPGMPGSDDGVMLPAFDEQARRGLMLAAFPALAHQIARTGDVPVRLFHALHLLDLLLEDAGDSLGVLDGVGSGGRLEVGVCERPDGCTGEDDDDPMCQPACWLDTNVLRADLASALAFDFLGSPLDRTGLTLDDIRPLLEQLRTGTEPRIFGHTAPIIELGGPRPIVRVLPSTVFDELDDTIVFDELGVPVHTAGDRRVELGAPGTDDTVCPVLHKFTHRLDHPDDNPIRWQFEVADQRGATIEPDDGMYRLRLRQRVPGEPEMDIGPWLTDWLPAKSLGSVPDGVLYEVTLLRSQVPALGLVSGEIEIELRGADVFGLETEPARYCWEHVPLAPPLQVRNVVEATGPGSLHEANLQPGNNLAPLLNGVPLEQGRAVMDLEIVNGTAEPVYVTFEVEQGLATFTKSWQKTNAFLFFAGGSDCLNAGDCTLGFPPERRTVIVTDEIGTIEELVGGVLVEDLVTGQRVFPCEGCDPEEYRIEPRIALGDLRVYRVRLVVTDLHALAPQPLDVDFGTFKDEVIDPAVWPTPITGRVFGLVRLCNAIMGTLCMNEVQYKHYAALLETEVYVSDIGLTARTSPSPELPAIMLPAQGSVLGAPVGRESFQWSATEESLPPLNP